jgi:hypothetical protein
MGLSAKEAADAVGISKQGIIKAITRGRISASKDKHGDWEIDAAELFRVYDPKKEVDAVHASTDSESISAYPPKDIHSLQVLEVELRTKLEAAEKRSADLETQLYKAEQREVQLMEMVKSQTRLLEHATESQNPRGWLSRILGIGRS